MSARTQRFTDRDFGDEVLDLEGLTVVDFWSFWCAPCQHRRGTLERLADEYAGLVRFGRVDVDENHRIAAVFEVVAPPTLLLFRNGRVVARLNGVASRLEIRELIQRQLAGGRLAPGVA